MRTKRFLHINSARFLNRIIGDIPIYNWATKKELSALKRDFYIKRAKKRGKNTAMYRRALSKQRSDKRM